MAIPASSSSKPDEPVWLKQVVLLRESASGRVVGGGCLIGRYHILTLRRIAQDAVGQKWFGQGAKVRVTLSDDNELERTATIQNFESGRPNAKNLALLRLSRNEDIEFIGPRFTTPLNYTGHLAETFGRNKTTVRPISCSFNETPQDTDLVWMSGMGKVLEGAPIWSNELSSFLGLAGSEQRNGEFGLYCVPGPLLASFVPRLRVDFRIPKAYTPKINDLRADDPNVELFGRESEKNGRRLSASIWPRKDGAFVVRMKYERAPNSEPSRGGSVTFITYPNLDPYQQIVRLDANGSAVAECYPRLPDFTIAAIGDGGATRLTLNLEGLPMSEAPIPGLEEQDDSGERDDSAEKAPETTADYRPTYAAFETDLVAFDRRSIGAPLKDTLNNGTYARHLAQLIVARKTPLPLSLGLFGDWGSGKSYFMRLLHQEIEVLSPSPKKSAPPKPRDEVFCDKVVQIHFNAWHYLDTNLWANLVCEIFDNLFAELIAREDTPNDKVEALKRKLAEEGALASEAKKALEEAKLAREQAEKALHEAELRRQEKEKTVAAFIDDLSQIAKDAGLPEELRKVADGIGIGRLKESFTELEARVLEARSLGGRFRSLSMTLLSPEGLWKRLALLLAALVSPFVVGALAPLVFRIQDAHWSEFTQSLAGAATLIASLGAWISRQTKRGSALLRNLEEVYAKVQKARETVRTSGPGAEKQKELDLRIKAEAEARHILEEAEARVRVIESELREMAPGRRLLKFLEQRAGANDYRQHLGLVSLVRRDFEQLSRLLQEGVAEKGREEPLLDRIVLYIDDLDRCKSDRVIAVLEAVHLLLAFPIFAVVVAVDPRWLRRSLLEHYPTLLSGGNKRRQDKKASVTDEEILASPHDYLEKIFQVPFQLQPMEEEGFAMLVDQLLPARLVTNSPPLELITPEQTSTSSGSERRAAQDVVLFAGSSEPWNLAPAKSEGGRDLSGQAMVDPPASDSAPAVAVPERLQLEEWEQAAVKLCHPLFRTPRAVKRLANTYCLIRTGVNTEDWRGFIGDARQPGAEYRTPLLMLAVSAAYPALSAQWFEKLKTGTGWLAEATGEKPDAAGTDDWQSLESALKEMDAKSFAPFDAERVNAWLPRVKRYSF